MTLSNHSFKKHFKRIAFASLLAGSCAFHSSPLLAAGDTTSSVLPTTERAIGETANGETEPREYWEDWCGWGTHDSCPVDYTKELDAVAAREKDESEVSFEKLQKTAGEHSELAQSQLAESQLIDEEDDSIPVFALAESLAQSTGVSIQQVIEPFAMVTPFAQSSLEQIAELQRSAVKIAEEIAAREVAQEAAKIEAKKAREKAIRQQIANDAFRSLGDDQLDLVVLDNDKQDVKAIRSVEKSVKRFDEILLSGGSTPPNWDTRDDRTFDVVSSGDMFRSELDSLAAEEPIDVFIHGPSVLKTPAETLASQANPPTSKPLIGSSPVIATIDESYMPYDIASRDLRIWPYHTTPIKPYCIVNRNNHVEDFAWWPDEDSASNTQNKEQAIETVTSVDSSVEEVTSVDSSVEEVVLVETSVECLVDEIVWKFDNAISSLAQRKKQFSPRRMGRRIGRLTGSPAIATQRAINAIARFWPESGTVESSTQASKELLARAEAIEAEAPSDKPNIEVAERLGESILVR